MPQKKHPQLQNSRDKEKNTTHSHLLPPVINLQLQIHSECQKKKTPTTAELQGRGKKHNTLPAASSSSESPTTNTFIMPQKKTPTIAELQGQGKKTQHTPSCFLQKNYENSKKYFTMQKYIIFFKKIN
jgi:hypothetical protein